MSLVQFWRIIWARKWLIAAAMFSCISGAYLVTLIVPPRWEAHARVLLNILKPDPITGDIVGGAATGTYVASQTELIKDYSVSDLAVARSGFLHNRELFAKYQSKSNSDPRFFRRWLAQTVTDHTKADIVEGSNILDISYTAQSPEQARAMAEALRQAYLDVSLDLRRADANRNADWFTDQAAKAKSALDTAEKDKSEYERANNVYMATDTTDVDSARLAALATHNGESAALAAGNSSAASIQLAEVDADIAQLSQVLGPNHPQLQALRAKRASLSGIVARERAAAATAGHSGTPTNSLDAQAALVNAKYDKLSQLKRLQAEVDLRRDLYSKASTRAAELRQQAAVSDVGLTPLGPVFLPTSPTFPNMPLILLGSLSLGLALGVMMALLVELLWRKVRGVEDLQWAVDAPVLTVILGPAK